MAVWQYDLFLAHERHALPRLTDDGWDLACLPAASTLIAQAGLATSLGDPWLMMDDWVVFGEEEGTRIDLVFDDADEVDIRIRLAAWATGAELDAVCRFTRDLRGALFDPAKGAVFQPDPSELASALGASHAAAFSRPPLAFLPRQSDA